MTKFHLVIISSIFLLVSFLGALHIPNLSPLNPVQSISANLDTGSTAPTFTPTPTTIGIGSTAPTLTPTFTPTNTPTLTPTATPTNTPTMTPTPVPYILTLDNSDARFTTTGSWKTSTSGTWYIGTNFVHDNNNQKGKKTGRWTPALPQGTYNVFVQYGGINGRASNVPYVITHTEGTNTVIVNQQLNGGQWVMLGTFSFSPTTGYVEVRTTNTNGFVVADAVRFEQVFN